MHVRGGNTERAIDGIEFVQTVMGPLDHHGGGCRPHLWCLQSVDPEAGSRAQMLRKERGRAITAGHVHAGESYAQAPHKASKLSRTANLHALVM